MSKVTRQELVVGMCDLLIANIQDGCSNDFAERYEAIINRYFAETGEHATFSDYYAVRDRQSKAALKKFSKQFVVEYFGEA